jgi:hypothetical protein
MKKTFVKYLSKAYNKPEADIEELLFEGDALKDTAEDSLLHLNAERIKQLKAETTEKFNDGYKKAEKEFKTLSEKVLKEVTGIDSDLVGDELKDDIKQKLEEKTSKKSTLKDDDIKKHPLFIEREKQLLKQITDEVAAVKTDFENYKTNITKTEKINKIKNKAIDIMASLNPILSSDATKAENQKRLFLREFDGNDYEIQDDGSIVIIADGKRLENKQGYPVTFDEFVKEKTLSIFDVKQQDAKGSTGNGQQQAQQQKQTQTINARPKTMAERNEAINAARLKGDMTVIAEIDKYYQDNKTD